MKAITAAELQMKVEAGDIVQVIDVREAEEVAEGRISGALHIPLGLLEFRMHELEKQAPYYVVCLAGGRSARATALLADHGYDVTNVTGGMLAWAGDVE